MHGETMKYIEVVWDMYFLRSSIPFWWIAKCRTALFMV